MADNNKPNKINEKVFNDFKDTLDKGANVFTESMDKLNEACKKSVSNVEKTIGNLGEGVLRKNKELQDAYNKYKETIEKQNQATKELTALIEQQNKSTEELNRLKGDNARLRLDIKDNETSIRNKESIIKEKKDLLATLTNVDESARDIEKIEKTTKEIEKLEKQVNKCKSENEKITKRITKNKKTILALNKNISISTQEINEKEKERLQILEEQEEIESKITEETEAQLESIERANKAKKLGLEILKLVGKELGKFKDKWVEVDNAVSKHNRQIGVSHAQSESYRKNVLKNYGEMAGRLGMTFEEMYKFQEQYAKNTNRATVLTNRQVETLAGLSKVVGDVATDEMVRNMDDFGASVDIASGYLAQSYAKAAQAGLNASKTSETFANNIKMASRYTFREGVNGVSKMIMLSERLKFNMQSMSSAMDKFSSIEGSIEGAANLQLLGGAYANNFGNPLQMMSMALMDAEGFTQSIVDTFSSFATFNREKGMADMSAFEKQRMKLAAESLGISYDDVWNIAAQSAKAKEIDKEIGARGDLDEYNKEFIRNKAQFDVEKQQFYITSFGEDGKEVKTFLNKIKGDDDINKIRQTSTKEEILQNDVHTIMKDLHHFVSKTVGETKSGEETYKGAVEQYLIGGARMEDKALTALKNKGQNITNNGNGGLVYGLANGALAVGGTVASVYGLNAAGKMFSGGLGGASAASGAASGGASFARKRKIVNARNGLKVGGKAAGWGWAAVQVGSDLIGAANAKKKYNNEIENIQNSGMGYYEQQQAMFEAKQNKNKTYGKAVGSSAGAIIGGIIGSFIAPGVGTAIGAGIGSSLGSWGGGLIGKNKTKEVTAQQVVGNQTQINNNLAQNMNSPLKIEPLDINLSGSIKLKGEKGGSQDVDVNKLLANTDFVRQIKDIISTEINKDFGERINKNTPYWGGGSSYQKYSNA